MYNQGDKIKVKNNNRPLIDDYDIHYVVYDFGEYVHTYSKTGGIYVQVVNKEDIIGKI